ncbi:MAG: GNAT family N-acetyltransferase [Anaerolineae bacterium]
MEIANDKNGQASGFVNRNPAENVKVWQAREADFNVAETLLKTAPWRHKHVDWFETKSWLGSPGFVMSHSQDGSKGCLAIVADPGPGAWVRVAALERQSFNRKQSFLQMSAMVDQVCEYLIQNGVKIIGWMAPIAWPDGWPEKLGFTESERVITYQKPTFKIPPLNTIDGLHIRAATSEDMPHLAEIESRAFPPIWRHSATGLNRAMDQAFSFDVALINNKLVGFQHSATGRGAAAHLARITVDPAVQGRGVGGHLLAHAIKGYQRRGAIEMTLNTESANVNAQRLYKRFGYRPSGHQFPLYTMALA